MNLTLSIGKFSESLRCKHADQYSILKQLIIVLFRLWICIRVHAVLHNNRIYKKELPKITPHICRHTYCSNMIKAGVNPKVVQYLMGHSSSEITLNIYTHVHLEDVIEELEGVECA